MTGRARRLLGRLWTLALCALMVSTSASARAAEPTTCRTVRLSDIGWTDVAATTAVTSLMLERLGYQPKVTVLSVPVTFAAMKNKDVDVFLGNWMPAMKEDRAPFLADKSIEVVRMLTRPANW